MELHQLVYDLLFKEQCVIVPELGGFISRDSPAGLNPITKELKPRTKSVFFNAHMLYDDGLLLNYVSGKDKITFEQAKEKVAKKVEDLKKVLHDNNKASFGEIGELIKNKEGSIILLVNKNLNLDLSTFGLETIGLKPIKKKVEFVPVEEKVIETIAPVQEKVVKERSTNWIPIAASVLLLAVLGYFAISGNWFSGAGNEVVNNTTSKLEQNAGVIPLDTEETQEILVVEEVSETEVAEIEEASIEEPSKEEETAIVTETETPTVQKEELQAVEVDNLSPEEANYLVVLGSFLSDENAQRYSKILAEKGIETSSYKKENSSLSRLVYKGFQSIELANKEKDYLKNTLQVNAIVFEN